MSIEHTAFEAFSEVLRLEREMDSAVLIICGLLHRLESANTIMRWQDDVRQKCQHDVEHWQIECDMMREEIQRYTRAQMS